MHEMAHDVGGVPLRAHSFQEIKSLTQLEAEVTHVYRLLAKRF